jgi:hypothetical protein
MNMNDFSNFVKDSLNQDESLDSLSSGRLEAISSGVMNLKDRLMNDYSEVQKILHQKMSLAQKREQEERNKNPEHAAKNRRVRI